MRKPNYDMRIFQERRQQLGKLAKGSAVIVRSHPEYIRNNDVHHPYRADSNLFYLTGFEEPECIFVFRPGRTPESVMFVRGKDPQRETWDGFRYGPDGTQKEFSIDKTFLVHEFEDKIAELLSDVDRVYYRWHIDSDFDQKILKTLKSVRTSAGRSGKGHLPIHDSWELLGEMRLKKSEYETETLRKACEISAEAHCEAMRFVKPGVNEREVHGVLLASMYLQGAKREGYGTIVASGNNATTLHYVFNDQVCKDGDLLLVDAGAEFGYYTGDITRTYPVNGRFTEPQRKVYEGVLAVQEQIIGMIKPGLVFQNLQDATIDKLTDLMLDLNLLSGSRAQLIETQAFKKYYMHGVSHYLGMDVHDAGLYLVNGEPRQLEVGMAFTVEPGIYIPANDTSAPAEFRGIGIRIEDDIVVTATGCDVLTKDVPKSVGEIETLMKEDPKLFRGKFAK